MTYLLSHGPSPTPTATTTLRACDNDGSRRSFSAIHTGGNIEGTGSGAGSIGFIDDGSGGLTGDG